MIDLHCHILPGMDDGPKSIEESISMAEVAVEDGINTIVATPHTLNGVYTNATGDVILEVLNLRKMLSERGLSLQIRAGADIHMCPNLIQMIKGGEVSTINNNQKYILLELPSQIVPSRVKEEIFNMKVNGITPIITHPERNAMIQNDVEILYDLVSMGALGQVTAMSLTGEFGTVVRDVAAELLKKRLVHVIASDAHSARSRPPVLSRAVDCAAEVLGNMVEAKRMVEDIPESILFGKRVDMVEPDRRGY